MQIFSYHTLHNSYYTLSWCAKKFNSISTEYREVKSENIDISPIPQGTIPTFHPWQIRAQMEKMKTNKATVPGDIPAKILKEHASLLCVPLTDIINCSIKTGQCAVPLELLNG